MAMGPLSWKRLVLISVENDTGFKNSGESNQSPPLPPCPLPLARMLLILPLRCVLTSRLLLPHVFRRRASNARFLISGNARCVDAFTVALKPTVRGRGEALVYVYAGATAGVTRVV